MIKIINQIAITEQELHRKVKELLGLINNVGTPEHKKLAAELLDTYTAINAKGKEKTTYSQEWHAYNQAQQKEKIMLMSLLDELLSYIRFPDNKGIGRHPISLRDRIFYLAMQCYNTKSSRRCISDLEIAKKLGYVTKSPHFNTVLKIQKDPELTKYLMHLVKVAGIPLQKVEHDFAIDSSGFSTSQFGRWFDVRLGSENEKRTYKKVHLTCGVITNIITAVKITPGTCNDSPELPSLVRQTIGLYNVREVSADKGYISVENLETIWDLGAIPFIPFKENVRQNSRHGMVWKKMLKFFTEYPEEFYHHYHKRSNVESTFNMLKRKFGSHLRSRSEVGQANEILAKCLCHNLCVLIQEAFEQGIDLDFKKCAEIEIAHNQTI
ncbi:MAG: transposase [Nanoarchaeota archaeon]